MGGGGPKAQLAIVRASLPVAIKFDFG